MLKRDISDSKAVHLLRNLYRAGVRETDEYVKEFFNILKQNHLLENSIIMITTDHGDEFGEHQGLSHDGKMYSELIDSPFIIIDFQREKEELCNKLVSNVDIAPTVLGLARQKTPKAMRGLNLLKNNEREIVFVEGGALNSVMARTKTLKLILQRKKSADGSIDHWGLLYDLEKDPQELNDLYDNPEYSSQQKKLTAAIENWLPVADKRNIYIDENAPVIDQPNVPKRNDGHRKAMKEYCKKNI